MVHNRYGWRVWQPQVGERRNGGQWLLPAPFRPAGEGHKAHAGAVDDRGGVIWGLTFSFFQVYVQTL